MSARRLHSPESKITRTRRFGLLAPYEESPCSDGILDCTDRDPHCSHCDQHCTDRDPHRTDCVTVIAPFRRPALDVVTIAALAVAIGLLPLPYDYYVLLRLFLCGLSLYFLTRPTAREAEKWVLGGLVLLYNPIVPIELGSKVVWSTINIATVAWFWTLNRRLLR